MFRVISYDIHLPALRDTLYPDIVMHVCHAEANRWFDLAYYIWLLWKLVQKSENKHLTASICCQKCIYHYICYLLV